jgi:hypothetical protein
MPEPPVSGKREKPFEALPPTRGLPSVQEARAQRKRIRWLPTRFWLWAFVLIGAGIIVWWKLEQGEIAKMKSELLARQRAVVTELGPRWFPLRDELEKWVSDCGAEGFVDHVEPELAARWDFRAMPGIYLRLAQKDSQGVDSIRNATQKSLLDAFTGCLVTADNPNPLDGAACETTEDCQAGLHCNEFKHCAKYSQPYNLRTAYRTMRVMTDEWVADIQEISNKLTMRGAVASFEAVNKHDLPVAADLLQRSKYFLVVVDEASDAPDELDNLPPDADAGVGQDDRSIPTGPHAARVCVYRLDDNAKVLAVRRDAAGALMGGTQPVDLRSRIAQQRQANSCALALSVREAMGAPAEAPSPPPQ